MEYPVWQIPYFGGGLLIAIIAIIHVYVAHFAVGGGLFLLLAELKGHRENSKLILDYTKKHTLFFLLLTMVFGSLTGVAIWFIIALTNPAATLTLIRTFTFGWATEWVFFLGEIVSLLVYYYTFGRMERRKHLTVGALYFFFGFMSLFMINGIIGSMLTPGEWLKTGGFWDGFFNPSFWPALFFRSFLAFSIAGLFAFWTGSRVEDTEVRRTLMRYSAKWAVIPLLLMVPAAWWYFSVLPAGPQSMILGGNNEITPFVRGLLVTAPAILALSLAMLMRLPRPVRRTGAIALLALGLVYMGSFEYVRESSRRPYVISEYMYSSGVTVAEAAEIEKKGFLPMARWTLTKEITDENRLEAGRELFTWQCMACHSVAGPSNDILPLTKKFTIFGMDAQLDGLGKVQKYMPPFMGTKDERLALATYIVEELHDGDAPAYEKAASEVMVPEDPKIPSFDKDKDEYVLVSWNNLGMHCISDSDPWWVLLPPANDLFCQLIRRGETPELVTEGVTLTYTVDKPFADSASKVRFWEFAKSLFGKEIPKNVGVSGNALSGEMHLKEDLGCFEASLIPVVPYPEGGGFNPYPIFTIEARDAKTGQVLATTRTVAPTSTEMGCKNCHGGKWRVEGVAGFTDETSSDILAMHDKHNKTNLLERAKQGEPQLCQSCHADPVLGTKGREGLISFPAAIHGWHANYLSDREEEACATCHPNNPEGPTRCLRGVHDDIGLTCINCHGALEDHALSLLKKDAADGRKAAEKLMVNLKPRAVDSVDKINARTPWLMEPDCLNCHKGFEPPDTMDAFNTWTSGTPTDLYRLRRDEMDALMCEACHGSPHAVYPARDSGYGENRDNIAPMQYMGQANPMGKGGNCTVCHKGADLKPEDSAHHPMGMR